MSLSGQDSTAFLRAVGRVTLSFGRLEFHTALLVQCLLCDNLRVGQTITSSMQIGPLLDLAVRLGRVRLATDVERMRALEALIAEVRSLVEKRHSVLHSFFGPDMGDGGRVGIRLRSKGHDVLQVSTTIVTPEALDKIADDAQALWPKLYDYLATLPPEITANYIAPA